MKFKLSYFLLSILSFIFIITPVYADGDDPVSEDPEELTDINLICLNNKIILNSDNPTIKLKYELIPEDIDNIEISWYSLNEDIAIVDETGLVTGLNYGEATIGLTDGNISKEVKVNVISEEENTLDNFIYNLGSSSLYRSESFHESLINNNYVFNRIVSSIIDKKISDNRISYQIEFKRKYTSTYDYTNYYNVTYSIEDYNGEIYSKTINEGLRIYVATELNNQLISELPDVVTSTIEDSFRAEFNSLSGLEGIFYRATNRKAFILDSTDISDNLQRKKRVDVIYGYTVNYSTVFYDRKTITIASNNEFIADYEVRNPEDFQNFIRYNGNIYMYNKTYTFNEELTNSYDFKQDYLGIYDVTSDNDPNYSFPLIVYREELPLTDIEVNSPVYEIPLGIDTFELPIDVVRTPDRAIYEEIIWSSSNPDVISISNDGIIKPLKLGTSNIKACDKTLTVCHEASIEVIPNDQVYITNQSGQLFLYNNGLLYYRNEGFLSLIDYNVRTISYSYYITNDNKLYYLNWTNIDKYKSAILVAEDAKRFGEGYTYVNLNNELYTLINGRVGEKKQDNYPEPVIEEEPEENNDSEIKKIAKLHISYNYSTSYYDYDYILYTNGHFCTPYTCMENVRDFSNLDGNQFIYVITNDNELYYISNNMKNEHYYLASNILEFYHNKLIKSIDGEYYIPRYLDDYPIMLYRTRTPYIKAIGALFDIDIMKDISIGDTLNITYTIMPLNATNKKVTWSVNNPDLAEINEDGILTAKSNGIVEVIATTADNYIAKLLITIHPDPNQISINDKPEEYVIADDFSDYIVISAEVGPYNTLKREIVWETDRPDLITLDTTRYTDAVLVYTKGIAGEATLYAKTQDLLHQDSMKIKLVHMPESISYQPISINKQYDNSYCIIPSIIMPNDFNQDYIEYYTNDNEISIDDNNCIYAYSEGNYTINVYVLGRLYTYIDVYVYNEEESNNYLNWITAGNNYEYINNPLQEDINLWTTELEVITINGHAYDENSTIEGNGTYNLVMGDNYFDLYVTNLNVSDMPRHYRVKIKRVEVSPNINISELSTTLDVTNAPRVYVNSNKDDSNIVLASDIEKAKNKEITLRINKYDLDLLLYSYDIEMANMNSKYDFDSYVTLEFDDSNTITNLVVYKFIFNYSEMLPESTILRLYVGDKINDEYLEIYEYDDDNAYLRLGFSKSYDGYISFDIGGYINKNELRLVIPNYSKGDINSNGRIDLSDIINLLKTYLGTINDNRIVIIGDMDYNGRITLYDIITLLKMYLYDN